MKVLITIFSVWDRTLISNRVHIQRTDILPSYEASFLIGRQLFHIVPSEPAAWERKLALSSVEYRKWPPQTGGWSNFLIWKSLKTPFYHQSCLTGYISKTLCEGEKNLKSFVLNPKTRRLYEILTLLRPSSGAPTSHLERARDREVQQ